MESARDESSNSEELAQILDRLVDHHQDGVPIDWKREIERHPQYADRLRSLAPMLELLGQCSQSARPSSDLEPVVGARGLTPGSQLGDFRIVRLVARGGMGLVFEAQQVSLGRRVALKVLSTSGVWDERLRQRFRHEAQAAAQLHHPHIVPVHAVGSDQEVEYYVMQLVNGPTLATVVTGWNSSTSRGAVGQGSQGTGESDLSETPTDPLWGRREGSHLPLNQPPANVKADRSGEKDLRAGLRSRSQPERVARYRLAVTWIISAAEAIEHAHQQGILHRDVKPANLMLDRTGWLWVADFGLARSRHELSNTASGELVGTLRYMSPEQASGSKFLDERTDVYALGATLYELLLLSPAFPQDNSAELLQAVVRGTLVSPRQLDPNLPRDLETIVMKAMAPQAADRYPSALALGEDLARWLENRPIAARRPGMAQLAARWVSRNPAMSMLIASVWLLAAMLAVGGAWYQSRLTLREAEVRQTESALRSEQYATLRTQALQLTFERPSEWTQRALDKLQRAAEIAPPGADLGELRSAAVNLLTAPDIVQVATLTHQDVVHCLKFNPRGDALAVGYNLKSGEVPIEIWDTSRHQLMETLRFPADPDYVTTRGVQGDGVRSLAFRRDGRYLAAGTRSGWIHLWDLADSQRLRTSWQVDDSAVLRLEFTRDSQALISGSQSGALIFWSVPDHQRKQERKFDDELLDFATSAGQRVLCAVNAQSALLSTGDLSNQPWSYGGVALAVTSSPTGRFSVWGVNGGRVIMLDTAGHLVREYSHGAEKSAHLGSVQSVACSADGSLIASGCSDHVLNVWNTSTGELVRRFDLGTNGRISGDFSAGQLLAVTADRETRLYRVNGAGIRRHVAMGAVPMLGFGAHHRYTNIATLSPIDTDATVWGVRQWNSQGRWFPTIGLKSRPEEDVLLSISGTRIAISNNARQRIAVYDQRKEALSWTARDVRAIRYDSEAQELWVACVPAEGESERRIGGVRGWSLKTGESVGQWLNEQAEADRAVTDLESLDLGKRLMVAGGNDGTVVILQRQPLQLLHQLQLQIGRIRAVVMGPEDRVVLAAGDTGHIALIDPATGSTQRVVPGEGDPIESMSISVKEVGSTGTVVVTGSSGGAVRIWQLDGTRLLPLFALPRQSGPIVNCQFAGQSSSLLTLARNQTSVQQWNLGLLLSELHRLGMNPHE